MGQAGKVFGKQITYSVSPFQQKLFVNYFKNAMPHLRRGVRDNFWASVPYMAALYITVNWANETYHNEAKDHWY
ncbi:hypothetical protein DICPUDRAFT_88458 [Dictyostelium purpureum]|uniref:Cytochrome b-c1 complex subunit 8 n=1 Tax=Dictyostelium purpureum TaxID=5786 RepID=F0ZPH8_DICPU|nr:uncharacterized protein DICPUDRAFT_88458 [Dictyostelium purpureum]EGC34169.1 hypothetical protein DICPUDRAFT_88458 [Dictyostelium purpureum]|eukprot:XP_003289323.1 hypothetical protein DICPUDRAFT_88458 [Dictyostelium purpureum]